MWPIEAVSAGLAALVGGSKARFDSLENLNVRPMGVKIIIGGVTVGYAIKWGYDHA